MYQFVINYNFLFINLLFYLKINELVNNLHQQHLQHNIPSYGCCFTQLIELRLSSQQQKHLKGIFQNEPQNILSQSKQALQNLQYYELMSSKTILNYISYCQPIPVQRKSVLKQEITDTLKTLQNIYISSESYEIPLVTNRYLINFIITSKGSFFEFFPFSHLNSCFTQNIFSMQNIQNMKQSQLIVKHNVFFQIHKYIINIYQNLFNIFKAIYKYKQTTIFSKTN
ncbi:hypothetical protein TTHERM_000433529 (macronuclear) [Tetrahymena thermophila SB210]|uniref:Uncharacterized protein n=1 Tax=Tetrahymena thermophila (strain SB210) TaxID=312017 RepID=W7X873_TETTS|nr:hypothetical protein TTHERM_000433529 [Tetrahymena thermophila SB210]EWS72608.1 hypothetical protein TTHERM_000433529 [Tetrahymena thermophila SB210]|eukprot:XP_012654891.1 hypothetical protein TTHERM_000433529 [Tetrahymena thermophila SB210]